MKHTHVHVIRLGLLGLALVVVLSLPSAKATTVTWVTLGASTNDWFNTNNWSGQALPANGDEVIINYTNVGVLLTNSTPALSSLLISNKATLIFSNWDTALNATNVTVATGAVVTCAGPFTNTVMSNRVWIVATNFILNAYGQINVKERGYLKSTGPGVTRAGTGSLGPGAGHGGFGANISHGPTATWQLGGYPYGSTNAPDAPGSGGSGIQGGAGGGVIRIAAGTATIDGTITADGGSYTGTDYAGGGSGGSIFLTAVTFGGSTTGLLTAAGGNGYFGSSGRGGGGAGGRIAVIYTNITAGTGVRFSAAAGTSTAMFKAEIGTLYFPDTNFISETMPQILNGRIIIPDFTSWSVTNLTLTNGEVALGDGEGFSLSVVSNLVIGSGSTSTSSLTLGRIGSGAVTNSVTVGRNATLNGGKLGLGGPTWVYAVGGPTGQFALSVLNVGGEMILTNNGCLWMYSGETNATRPDYGALVTITGDVSLSSGSWIYCHSNPTNGGSTLFRLDDLLIVTNAGFNAESTYTASTKAFAIRGYKGWQGPGAPAPIANSACGAGYGGEGGGGYLGSVGPTYGFSNAPIDPGSGGARYTADYSSGGAGGGAIRIEAVNVTLNGALAADASDASGTYGGGGSGGSIYVRCRMFSGGANASLSATGGDGLQGAVPTQGAGGGGGGRIAVWSIYWGFSGTASVTNGLLAGTGNSTNGVPGTIVWGQLPVPGTIFTGH
ncbi:MAG: hypothetical protein HYV35_00740 [Lentisphaerae bacterium]|nr:hypothetical protein [Lentisphaerota bacterium]